MTFVKVVFVLLILAPVAILMWHILSRLIADFTESAKESAQQEREKARALKEAEKKETMNQGRYVGLERYRSSSAGHSDHDVTMRHTKESPEHSSGNDKNGKKRREKFGLKQAMDKRKRRKERRKKKVKEQEA